MTVRGGEERVDGVAGGGGAAGEREPDVAHPVGAVDVLAGLEGHDERGVGAGVDRDVGTAQLGHVEGVLHGEVEGHVAGDDPDADDVDVGMTQRHHEGDGVVAGGVGVDEERSGHDPQFCPRNEPDPADSDDRTRWWPKNVSAPGGACRLLPGAARRGTNHPPLVDLLALASRSTSHRPSCPEARRAMPRYRPGGRLPDSVPVTAPFTLSRTSPRHRSDTVRTVNPEEPVGVAPRGLGPATPYDRPANRPAVRRGGWWHSSRAPVPLTPREPARFPPESPEGDSDRLGYPVPVGVALSGTGHRFANASPQVKT